jgi:hypothetical protein
LDGSDWKYPSISCLLHCYRYDSLLHIYPSDCCFWIRLCSFYPVNVIDCWCWVIVWSEYLMWWCSTLDSTLFSVSSIVLLLQVLHFSDRVCQLVYWGKLPIQLLVLDPSGLYSLLGLWIQYCK